MSSRKLIFIVILLLPGLCRAQDIPNTSGPTAEGSSGNTKNALNSDPSAAKLGETTNIVPGQLTYRVDAKYPKEARKREIQGPVVLRATIGKDGIVSTLGIVSGDMVLAEAAVDAVHQWKYEPYTRNGEPITVEQDLTLNFVPGKQVAELDSQVLPPRIPTQRFTASPNTSTTGAGVFRVGGGVTAPKAIHTPEPEYDKQARKSKYQGVCVLSMIVAPDGKPRDIKVIRALGQGLDAKAVEAVAKWKFDPATKDGNPVAVVINVEVEFHLY